MAQAKTKINKELLTEWVINMLNSFADIDSHIVPQLGEVRDFQH
jgi:hypothetical protein